MPSAPPTPPRGPGHPKLHPGITHSSTDPSAQRPICGPSAGWGLNGPPILSSTKPTRNEGPVGCVSYLGEAVRKKPSKRLLQKSSRANSSARSARLPVSKWRKMSLKARSPKVSTVNTRGWLGLCPQTLSSVPRSEQDSGEERELTRWSVALSREAKPQLECGEGKMLWSELTSTESLQTNNQRYASSIEVQPRGESAKPSQ